MDATGAGLLRAVLEVPGCDDRRLVYADWLEEQGDGEYAEFVRVQCALAAMESRHRHECTSAVRRGMESRGLKTREGELLSRGYWRFPMGTLWSGAAKTLRWDYSRGFIESVSLPRAAFMEHAHALFARHPITAVTLTDCRPREISDWQRPAGPRQFVWGFYYPHKDHATEPAHRLPQALHRAHPGEHLQGPHPSPEAALHALSLAAANYGRSLHALPALT
jgi:uncharacterized protein (TIGR02996 family)